MACFTEQLLDPLDRIEVDVVPTAQEVLIREVDAKRFPQAGKVTHSVKFTSSCRSYASSMRNCVVIAAGSHRASLAHDRKARPKSIPITTRPSRTSGLEFGTRISKKWSLSCSDGQVSLSSPTRFENPCLHLRECAGPPLRAADLGLSLALSGHSAVARQGRVLPAGLDENGSGIIRRGRFRRVCMLTRSAPADDRSHRPARARSAFYRTAGSSGPG